MRTKFSGILTLLLAFVVQISFAQEKTVTGTVTDPDGLPLPGVNIVIKETSRGTQTDFNGEYSVDVIPEQVLVFSYVGFTEEEVVIGNSNTYNVQMNSNNELDDVVIKAYGSTTKRKSTQAVTTITSETLENRPNANLIQSMQGQVAGLNIGTASGQPGADNTIILRGVGSINGNIEPLFIIDGVPVSEDNFRSLNPNDIESIDVRRDASATSIYGNRGANGVIVINTKSGKFNQKLKFDYSAQYGFAELQNLNIELMNSREKLYFQQSLGEGRGGNLSDAEIERLAARNNTYWADYFFRTAQTNSHNLSITSGGENLRSFTSLGYFKQEGTYIASDLQRFSFRNKMTAKTNDDKFNITANINANFSESNFDDSAGSRQIYFNPYSAAMQSLPFLSPFDPDGTRTITGGLPFGNGPTADLAPYILLNSAAYNTNRDEEIKIVGNLDTDYKFAKNFNFGTTFGVDFTSQNNNEILHPLSLLGPFQAQTGAEFGGLERNGYTRDAVFNTTLNLGYGTTIEDKHTITANLFSEYIKSHLWHYRFEQRGLDPKTLGTGDAFVPGETVEGENRPYIPTLGKVNLETGLFSYFGTLDYDYDGRFGFFGSIRRDASSRFTDEYTWGTFWSVSGRWNIDAEDFMQGSDINLLKLRVSYGTAGNDRITGAVNGAAAVPGYQPGQRYGGVNLIRNAYSFGAGYNNTNAYTIQTLANTSLRWEQTAQANIGVEFAVWNNKLQGGIDVYRKETTDLFQSRPISLTNGQGSINANIGDMVNRGIEANLNYTIYDDTDWRISVNANASFNKNEVTALPASAEDGILFDSGSTSLGVGEPVGSFYVVRYQGVNPANGRALFLDADGNLTEDLVDADRVFTDRQQYPIWQGGFGATLSYKGFSLSNQWVWFSDLYRNNLDMADLESNSNITDRNSAATLLNAWKQPGDITEIPEMRGQYTGVDFINRSDRYLEDASYLRLRNLMFGYTFSPKALEKLPFTNLKLFVQGKNLVTFSKWRGWDAESSFTATEVSRYPTPKIYSFGLNLTF